MKMVLAKSRRRTIALWYMVKAEHMSTLGMMKMASVN
jgi:hypothetical protein